MKNKNYKLEKNNQVQENFFVNSIAIYEDKPWTRLKNNLDK